MMLSFATVLAHSCASACDARCFTNCTRRALSRRVASQAWRNTGQAALEHRLNPVVSRVANARGEINAHGAAKKEKADAMNVTLPQWCADIISSPPRSGEGFHNWLFRAARGLWRCGR